MNPTLPSWLIERKQLRERVFNLEELNRELHDACESKQRSLDSETSLLREARAELSAAKDEIAKLKAQREKLIAFVRNWLDGPESEVEEVNHAEALLAELGVPYSPLSGGEG